MLRLYDVVETEHLRGPAVQRRLRPVLPKPLHRTVVKINETMEELLFGGKRLAVGNFGHLGAQ